jgi:hypothetical protein
MKTPGSAEGAAPARTRPVLRRLSLSLVALAFAAFAASALAGSFAAKGAFQISSSLTSADPVVINPPYGDLGHRCGRTSEPLYTEVGIFHYETFTFRNISSFPATQCVSVSLAVSSGEAMAQVYRGAFDPLNPFNNFVGDSTYTTVRAGYAETHGFSFDAEGCYCAPPAPTPYTVVVRESDLLDSAYGPAIGATYTLLVEGTGIILTGGTPTASAALQSFRASSAPKGVLVRWRTRSEHEALGFNLYRGGAKKIRLTRSIIRASGDGRGHTYSYLDRSARKGKAAPYYLEVVQRSGSKIMFGPALRTAH